MTQRSKQPSKKKTVAHHAKRLYHGTPKFVHGMVVGGFIGFVLVLTLSAVAPSAALSLQSPRDCDTNAVINCGVLTTAELQKGYNDAVNTGVTSIYKYFGITANDIKNADTLAVSGRVYKDGRVMVGKNLVATNAISAGRRNAQGSKKITYGGATFYTRPPSTSFAIASIAAYVYMQDGTFKAAILAGCGNPVSATSVTKKATPVPPPTPTTVEDVLPPPTVTTTSTQLAESQPTPVTLAVATTTSALPDTGPGSIGLIALVSIVSGYAFHVTHRRIQRKRRAGRI